MHADEADSALSAIRGRIPPQLYATLDRLSAWQRSNPDGAAPGEGSLLRATEAEGDDSIGFSVLIPIARMVTGQWGAIPGVQNEAIQKPLNESIGSRALERGLRRRLPIANPSSEGEVRQKDWDKRGLYDRDARGRSRLDDLRELLLDAEVRARKKYDGKGVKPLAEKGNRGWEAAMRQCRADVEWVIAREKDALAGKARVVERDEYGNVLSVMGITPGRSEAWKFEQRGSRKRPAQRIDDDGVNVPQAERKPWGIVSAKGNMKLPFASYSTLPMSSCPGAGGCKVELIEDAKTGKLRKDDGWCYSFTAWRYPDSFARQFRNCLAEFTDREFAIIKGGGGEAPNNLALTERVELALRGRSVRTWHQLCRDFFVRDLSPNIKPAAQGGKPAFVRLYVDGDINSEDNVFEWMQVCAELQQTRIVDGDRVIHPGIQVYGYSKCWDQFLLLDRRNHPQWRVDADFVQSLGRREALAVDSAPSDAEFGGGKFSWPSNYTLNMSGDSRWNSENNTDTPQRRITIAVSWLPIARGYFKSIRFEESIEGLDAQFQAGNLAQFPAPPSEMLPFPFNRDRMLAVLMMNAAMNPALGIEAVDDAAGIKDRETAKRGIAKAVYAAADGLKKAYSEIVAQYGLIELVKRRQKKTGEVTLVFPSVPKFKADETKEPPAMRKAATQRLRALSEELLKGLYKAWFHRLYLDGIVSAQPAPELERFASAFEGDVPRPFAKIVMRELALDDVVGKAEPLSPAALVDQVRAEKMADRIDNILKTMGRSRKVQGEDDGREFSLAKAIVYVDQRAKVAERQVRDFDAIMADLRAQGLGDKVAKFKQDFDPERFLISFGATGAYQKKALAVALHEVLWTAGLGGSCPLVCGNCYDTPTAPKPGTPEYLFARHRCASTDGFKGTTINIGLH